jgi:hypothetical protein
MIAWRRGMSSAFARPLLRVTYPDVPTVCRQRRAIARRRNSICRSYPLESDGQPRLSPIRIARARLARCERKERHV